MVVSDVKWFVPVEGISLWSMGLLDTMREVSFKREFMKSILAMFIKCGSEGDVSHGNTARVAVEMQRELVLERVFIKVILTIVPLLVHLI